MALKCLGYSVELAQDQEEVLACLRSSKSEIAAVLLDIMMPNGDGIDTLREMKQELGDSAILCFMLGADAFMKLPEWYSWREMFGLCHFIVAARPGHPLLEDTDILPRELMLECQNRWVSGPRKLGGRPFGLVFLAPTILLDISATNIRACISSGKSARYLLPDATLDYISANRLYLEGQ